MQQLGNRSVVTEPGPDFGLDKLGLHNQDLRIFYEKNVTKHCVQQLADKLRTKLTYCFAKL